MTKFEQMLSILDNHNQAFLEKKHIETILNNIHNSIIFCKNELAKLYILNSEDNSVLERINFFKQELIKNREELKIYQSKKANVKKILKLSNSVNRINFMKFRKIRKELNKQAHSYENHRLGYRIFDCMFPQFQDMFDTNKPTKLKFVYNDGHNVSNKFQYQMKLPCHISYYDLMLEIYKFNQAIKQFKINNGISLGFKNFHFTDCIISFNESDSAFNDSSSLEMFYIMELELNNFLEIIENKINDEKIMFLDVVNRQNNTSFPVDIFDDDSKINIPFSKKFSINYVDKNNDLVTKELTLADIRPFLTVDSFNKLIEMLNLK